MPSNPQTSSHPGVWRQLLALVALSAVGSVMPLGAPALAGVLARGFAFSPSQVGLYFLSELGATSLVSLPAILLVRYVPLRQAMAMAVAGFVVFNLLSWFAGSYAWLLALRVGASAAGGTVMILTMTGIARLPRQEVGFGAWVAGQLMLSALVILAFPVIADHIGVQGVYVFVALLMAGAAVTLPWLPASVAPGAAEVGVSVDILGTGLRIGGVLLFYLAIAGIWTFLEKIGVDSGLLRARVDSAMATAALFGIVGGLCASAVGRWVDQRGLGHAALALMAGYGLIVVALLALIGDLSGLRFLGAACVFKFAWTFTVPFVLARIVRLAKAIETMAVVNLTLGAGFALGPVAGGYVLQISGGTTPLLLGACLLLAGSVLLILVRRRPRGLIDNVS